MFTKARLIINISSVLRIPACVFSPLYFMVNFLFMVLYNSSHYYVPYFLTTDDTDKTRKCGTSCQMRYGKKLTMKHWMKTTVNQKFVARWHIHVFNRSNKLLKMLLVILQGTQSTEFIQTLFDNVHKGKVNYKYIQCVTNTCLCLFSPLFHG